MSLIKINNGLVINIDKLTTMIKGKNHVNQEFTIDYNFTNSVTTSYFKEEEKRDSIFKTVSDIITR